jgi:hypothetical protein
MPALDAVASFVIHAGLLKGHARALARISGARVWSGISI